MGDDLDVAARRTAKLSQANSFFPSAPSNMASCENGRFRSSLRPSPFEIAPSEEEAEAAMTVLKQIFISGIFSNAGQTGHSNLDKESIHSEQSSSERTREVALAKGELDKRPTNCLPGKAMQLNCSKELQFPGKQNILNLFNLLRVNPSLQRLVVSLATDKVIWDAIMKNEAVHELKESFLTGCRTKAEGNSQYDFLNGVGDLATSIFSWIMENLKSKVMELIGKITLLAAKLFYVVEGQTSVEMVVLDNMLRSLFMLSLILSIIVVITRIRRMKTE